MNKMESNRSNEIRKVSKEEALISMGYDYEFFKRLADFLEGSSKTNINKEVKEELEKKEPRKMSITKAQKKRAKEIKDEGCGLCIESFRRPRDDIQNDQCAICLEIKIDLSLRMRY